MMMSVQKDNEKINWVALLGAVFTLMIVVFIMVLIKLITPIPPFPESMGSGGMEINYGVYNPGTGDVEENTIGEATNVMLKETALPSNENTSTEEMYTSENGENIDVTDNKIEVNQQTTVIHPTEVKEKPKTTAEILAEKFQKNKGKGGGDGHSGNAGNDGEPDGNPFAHGKGGVGNNPDGNSIGSGSGKGNAPFGFDLKGRSLVSYPPLPKDAKEEGLVVVDIKVDKEGNVIEADPNGRGTTTTSPILKAKARQFALQLKFTPNSQFEEQKGSISIVFSFK